MATWGTDIPEDLELNEEALANALKKVRCHSFHSYFHLQKCFFLLQIKSDTLACVLVMQEDLSRREEKDERKRKYNVKYNNDVMII